MSDLERRIFQNETVMIMLIRVFGAVFAWQNIQQAVYLVILSGGGSGHFDSRGVSITLLECGWVTEGDQGASCEYKGIYSQKLLCIFRSRYKSS